MPARPVRLFGDPVLRTRADEVVDFDRELATLVRDLWDTMTGEGGAGLAAPQLGVSLRVFTYQCEEEQDGPEGCLSIPGLSWDCRRHLHIVARGWNMHGDPLTVHGNARVARAIQHETDHLDGVLFVDRLDLETRRQAMRESRQVQWFAREGSAQGAPLPGSVVKVRPHPLLGRVR